MYHYMPRYRSLRNYRLEGYANSLFNRVLMRWLDQSGYCPTHANLSAIDRIKSILQNKSKIKAQLQFGIVINEVLNANAKDNNEIREMQDELEGKLNRLVEETFFTPQPQKSSSSDGTLVACLVMSIIALFLGASALALAISAL